jgi:hypothetical protein
MNRRLLSRLTVLSLLLCVAVVGLWALAPSRAVRPPRHAGRAPGLRLKCLRLYGAMKRRLLDVLAVLSLAAFLAAAWMWADSPWGFDHEDQHRIIVRGDAYFLASRAGGLRVMRQRATTSGPGTDLAEPGRLGFWQIGPRLGLWQKGLYGALTIATRFGPAEPDHHFLGFGWGRVQYSKRTAWYAPERQIMVYTLDYDVVAMPYWALLLATGLAPALWLRGRLRRRGRLLGGRCPRCGYDLRASPGRCPECGMIAPSPPVP